MDAQQLNRRFQNIKNNKDKTNNQILRRGIFCLIHSKENLRPIFSNNPADLFTHPNTVKQTVFFSDTGEFFYQGSPWTCGDTSSNHLAAGLSFKILNKTDKEVVWDPPINAAGPVQILVNNEKQQTDQVTLPPKTQVCITIWTLDDPGDFQEINPGFFKEGYHTTLRFCDLTLGLTLNTKPKELEICDVVSKS